MIFDVADIEEKIKYSFKDKELLKRAFTHSSYANENSSENNEKLEFLGDSILDFVIAEYLLQKLKNEREGVLTRQRALIVSAKPLYNAVKRLDIGSHLLLGVGESNSKLNKENIYADLFESIVAAIYLDSNLNRSKDFILYALKEEIIQGLKLNVSSDYKTKLQELVQGKKLGKIAYKEISRKGPDHNPVFKFEVLINGVKYGEGKGNAKKEAQQLCAKQALEKLKLSR